MSIINTILKRTAISILVVGFPLVAHPQSFEGSLGKGLGVTTADSTFSFNFSLWFQTFYGSSFNPDTDTYSDVLQVRRARLKMDGFVHHPNLRYRVLLGFSNFESGGGNADEFNNAAKLIQDVILKYRFADNWDLWFGQFILPGNRERITPARKLQMVDRNLVNAIFNIDRDIGILLQHRNKLGPAIINQIVAITTGDGRNIVDPNIGGYSYTGRLEYLPMGEFTSNGDYSGSDLQREPTGKLAIGMSYNFTDDAGRSNGQRGAFMIDENGLQYTNDLRVIFIDLLYKNKGFSLHGEYASKKAREKFIVTTTSGGLKYVTGNGISITSGYLFKNDIELSGRFAAINADDIAFSSVLNENEYMIGFSKYIAGHALKIQTDLSYRERESMANFVQFRFQIQVGL